MDDLKSQGAKAFIWDFFGKMARHGTGFIVTIFLARLLDPTAFGLIAMIMVIVMVAMVFTDVGLGAALIQRRRVLPVHYASVFYFNTFIGALLTLMTYFSASWISDFYNNKELTSITQVMSFLFVINAFSSMQTNKLRKELNYAALAKSDVGASILSGVIGIVLAYFGAGAWSLVAHAVSRGIFYNVFVWNTSSKSPLFLFSFKALRQLWGFGFRMFISGLLEKIYIRLDVIIIGKLFDAMTLGFYDQAKRLNNLVVQYSSGSIMAVLFPVLSKVQNDLQRFRHIVIKILEIICFVVFMLLGGMYLVSEELIVVLFTEKWLPAVEFFKILILSGFGYPVSALLVNVLSSRGNSRTYLRLEIYKKILLGINFYVGFLWGVEGYLYGLVIVTVLGVSLNMVYASREIDLPVWQIVKPIVLQMILSIVAVISVIYCTAELEIGIILLILIKGILFIFMFLLLNVIFKTASLITIKNQIVQVLQRKYNKGH